MTIFAKLKERLSFLLGKSKIVENMQLKASDTVPVDSSFIADSQKQSLDTTNNKEIRRKQYNFLLLLLGGSIIAVLVLINIMQGKIKHKAVINSSSRRKSA
ncbi:hypothetical protein [Candidatus Tisiphia endosymbiont of Melanophora roralis]|uniref:hypothetical protein n=1 Tax=Candidatus Tisiphia endosymbiont of Melanophora roralis TaxID=3066261 RepID=UPI00312C8F9E